MAIVRQLSKFMEYLLISSRNHVRHRLSGRPQIGKANIVEDDHNTTITRQTNRLIRSRKRRGGSVRRSVMIVVDGEDSTQTISGMVHPLRRQMDREVQRKKGAINHESSMMQLALRMHIAHKGRDFSSSIARSLQQVL